LTVTHTPVARACQEGCHGVHDAEDADDVVAGVRVDDGRRQDAVTLEKRQRRANFVVRLNRLRAPWSGARASCQASAAARVPRSAR
jgi:hypothetical protein